MALIPDLNLPDLDLPINYDRADYVTRKIARLQYAREQDGNCLHCGAKLHQRPSNKILGVKINMDLFPADFFFYPVHLHHDHKTGLTIGAVHALCNAYLWQYRGE